ncbi:AT-rich interactive domain-containing protein 5B-like isoform X1 [Mya arenaria]|uniref:AT-rich interactive domain-containing protein 5B-like isoform X1 n=1 Tax=Mya arenaria TaxID=6604 RepID=UPI0022E751BA|nr:AT-rich interactive domain-containing protein 5B-like isoform X1 [Mya arenaria]
MEDVKVRKFGPTCGKHGSSTFFKAFKYKKDGKSKIISLGQFFFMKILDSIPICIAELQLVWEEKHSSSDLASVRLYFLPECTPDGRQPNHGEDEVLAYYEKIVLKLSDLASLIVHDVSWSEGRAAFMGLDYPMQPGHKELAEAFGMNSFGLDNRDIEKEKIATEGKQPIDSDCSPDIIVMTYSRYCRYRCMLKRLEGCEDKWLKNALVCAIGGFAAQKENNRVYFCKDIFEHADLDDFELRCDHLAPNLKGRPRGRRKSSVRREGGGESEEENSSCSSSFSSNMDTANKIRTGSRATPLRNGFRIDKIKVSKDEQAFLIDLHQFMKRRNTAIGRIPSLGFKQIDLFQFYSLAEDIGGYEQISNKRMWKHLYDKLGGNPGFTSAATCTRRHYEKLLLPYERYRNEIEGRTLAPVKRKKLKPDILAGAHRYDIMGDNSRMEKKALNIAPAPSLKDMKAGHTGQKMSADAISILSKAGHTGHKLFADDISKLSDRALIIKQEIEKMKMRKDAKKQASQLENNAKKFAEKTPPMSESSTTVSNKSVVSTSSSIDNVTVLEAPTISTSNTPISIKEVKVVVNNISCTTPVIHVSSKVETKDTGSALNEASNNVLPDQQRKKLQEKGRKPFTAQKTVRELLHQNGIEPKDTNTSRLDMEHKENKLRASNNVPERRILESNTSNIGVKSEPSSGVANNVFSTSSSFQSDIKPLPATLLPVPNQARPMFYPQILPVGGAMSPMGMPFMIPSFNYQPISASIQSLPANVRNPVSIKEEQPLTALNKMAASASHNSSVSSGKSAMSNTVSRPMISPPSAHTFSVKTSSSALSPFPQRPITPAHTNNNKRQYPPSDSNKNFSHPMGNSSSVLGHESDVKRQKLHGSQSNIYSSPSSSGNLDAPVLDLSMKTMKAQEAKHHRGESLLFDASFTREGNFIPKSEPYDAPQDLSKKSQFNPMENVGERNLSCHKNVPLNVPHPHSMPYIKKEEPSPVNPETSESMTPQIGSKLFPGMTSMAGLPMDPSAMFHPAFPQQMLMGGLGLPGMSGGIPGMGGLFPTPLQLQQMIQGQVAGMGGFPFLRPDFLQGPVMFPGMNPGMFTSVAPSVIKSNPSGSTAGKR